MLRTVNVILTEEARDGPALSAAIALARRLEAHLDVICLAVEYMPVYGGRSGSVAIQLDRGDALKRTDALIAWAAAVLPADLGAKVERVTADTFGLVGTIARVSRYSDLAVTGRPYGPDHAGLGPVVAEGLLFGTGVPVLVVPDADRTDWSRPFRHLCLAWNDGDEAMRAARAALPFLQEASKVDVAVIGSAADQAHEHHPVDMLRRWLTRHEVGAGVSFLVRTDRSKAEMLAEFAADRGCEALVMGAYGHSRLREMLLGGTTRDLLSNVPLPLLMAH